MSGERMLLASRPGGWAVRNAMWALAGSMGALLGGALLAAGPSQKGGGTIAGRVSYTGAVPAVVKRKLIEDPTCAAMHKDGLEIQKVRVKDGNLGEVLVYVKSGVTGKYTPPTEPALIDQRGCEWFPRMVVVMAGQPLRISNSDHTSHNVHPLPKINKEFNIMQPRQGMVSTKMFDKPELMIPLGCSAHPWMEAFISVMAHPFFSVTGEDGRFEIGGLPDGEYEIEAVHGDLGRLVSRVTVKGATPASLDFTFTPRKAG